MVKITSSFVLRTTPKYLKGLGSQTSKEDFLKKLTHLHLQNKFIDAIGDISCCKNLTVIYLHNNCLERIENLHHAVHLTHLYLQRNKIHKIENLDGLINLKKLYLGHNQIVVVEGLESLPKLEELHIEKQKLPAGETLYFDPRSITVLTQSLRVLNISGNGLTSITDLGALRGIQHFIARNNKFDNVMEIINTLKMWTLLSDLELQENPICLEQKYKEKLIVHCCRLMSLNGKDITNTTRHFLRKLHYNTTKHKKTMPKYSVGSKSFSDDIASWTKNIPPSLRHSISQNILQDVQENELVINVSTSQFPVWSSHMKVKSSSRLNKLVSGLISQQMETKQQPEVGEGKTSLPKLQD